MANIYHDFVINASAMRVYDGVSTPEGLDQWWTSRSKGIPEPGAVYELWFGPEYDWRAVVTHCVPNSVFELELTEADQEWKGTRVGFQIAEKDGRSSVHFQHLNWPALNDHYRISSYCWAMYLRILKRWLEYGEEVPYAKRLEV